jgi:succinate-semialdehyde dehydrogenase/glutarate-semialdehyde dehydrogenase
MTFQTTSPATGAVVASYEEISPEAVQDIIASAHQAYLAWRHTSFRERAALMRRAADVLRGNAREYARLMAEEMGKPIRDGIAEIQKCAGGCDYYAENAERFLAPEPVVMEAHKSYIAFNPLGVVLAVMPWNFPFWQVFRFAAPGLMAGNAAMLKHASNVLSLLKTPNRGDNLEIFASPPYRRGHDHDSFGPGFRAVPAQNSKSLKKNRDFCGGAISSWA